MGKNRAYRRFSRLFKHENIMRDIHQIKISQKWSEMAEKITHLRVVGARSGHKRIRVKLKPAKKSNYEKKKSAKSCHFRRFYSQIREKKTKKKSDGKQRYAKMFFVFFFFFIIFGMFFFQNPSSNNQLPPSTLHFSTAIR
jgi:dipeptide/tripeptide permease